MRVFQKSMLFFLDVHLGIGALIVVFAMIIVQIGHNALIGFIDTHNQRMDGIMLHLSLLFFGTH
jgi:hypothetical protein